MVTPCLYRVHTNVPKVRDQAILLLIDLTLQSLQAPTANASSSFLAARKRTPVLRPFTSSVDGSKSSAG